MLKESTAEQPSLVWHRTTNDGAEEASRCTITIVWGTAGPPPSFGRCDDWHAQHGDFAGRSAMVQRQQVRSLFACIEQQLLLLELNQEIAELNRAVNALRS